MCNREPILPEKQGYRQAQNKHHNQTQERGKANTWATGRQVVLPSRLTKGMGVHGGCSPHTRTHHYHPVYLPTGTDPCLLNMRVAKATNDVSVIDPFRVCDVINGADDAAANTGSVNSSIFVGSVVDVVVVVVCFIDAILDATLGVGIDCCDDDDDGIDDDVRI